MQDPYVSLVTAVRTPVGYQDLLAGLDISFGITVECTGLERSLNEGAFGAHFLALWTFTYFVEYSTFPKSVIFR